MAGDDDENFCQNALYNYATALFDVILARMSADTDEAIVRRVEHIADSEASMQDAAHWQEIIENKCGLRLDTDEFDKAKYFEMQELLPDLKGLADKFSVTVEEYKKLIEGEEERERAYERSRKEAEERLYA